MVRRKSIPGKENRQCKGPEVVFKEKEGTSVAREWPVEKMS